MTAVAERELCDRRFMGPGDDVHMVCFDIDLETVELYEVWKPDSVDWALTVGWAKGERPGQAEPRSVPGDGPTDGAAVRRGPWSVVGG